MKKNIKTKTIATCLGRVPTGTKTHWMPICENSINESAFGIGLPHEGNVCVSANAASRSFFDYCRASQVGVYRVLLGGIDDVAVLFGGFSLQEQEAKRASSPTFSRDRPACAHSDSKWQSQAQRRKNPKSSYLSASYCRLRSRNVRSWGTQLPLLLCGRRFQGRRPAGLGINVLRLLLSLLMLFLRCRCWLK
jgi:hypothetical protein